ncbi:dephospho-CoA kinase [Chromatium okenii]|uniref:dephospho-CoA kinase n=1 Tax=Chromatium okenii TaxID=61644 RepID=UPI0026EEE146|nr:dephospho-CoA kinase [Chromatium okenii]MBV5309180.1 dephospho-CoA kinase [Chromatium okenii]
MFSVALTGGIGSGKSTVADQLAALGADVIDTDVLARELTAVGQPLLQRIAVNFGAEMLLADGALDRAALRQRVFQSPSERKRLEALLHPAIEALMLERRAALTAPYAVLVIPLLFETGQQQWAQRVLVVDVPEAVQIERVQQRSGLATDEIKRIIASQIARAERLARADDLIDNSGNSAVLIPQIKQLHERYLQLAGA